MKKGTKLIDVILSLSKNLSGEFCFESDNQYEEWHRESHWNERKFQRFPYIIVKAASIGDVVETIKFARRERLKVSLRSSGFSFSGTFLNEASILLDVSALKQVEYKSDNNLIVIGPGVNSQELNQVLAIHNCGFPVAHAGIVGMAGFLLGGGLGINFADWGDMSAFNVVALDIVTADGELKHITVKENADFFWASRGAGPYLFFAVVRFYLKCFPIPNRITTQTLRLPYRYLSNALLEIEKTVLDKKLQLSLAVIPSINSNAPEDYHREIFITSTAFANDTAHSAQLHSMIIPKLEKWSLENAINEQVTTFAEILDKGNITFIKGHYRTDNILTDQPQKTVQILTSHLEAKPSFAGLPLFIWRGNPALPDAAFSASGSFYFSTYVRWDEGNDGEEYEQWLINLYDELQTVATNSYINEFDLEARSSDISHCFSKKGWQRLYQLRKKLDPDGVFHDISLI